MRYIIHFASGRTQTVDGLKPINAGSGTIFLDPSQPIGQNIPVDPVVIVPHENVEFIEREGGTAGIYVPNQLGRQASGIILP